MVPKLLCILRENRLVVFMPWVPVWVLHNSVVIVTSVKVLLLPLLKYLGIMGVSNLSIFASFVFSFLV